MESSQRKINETINKAEKNKASWLFTYKKEKSKKALSSCTVNNLCQSKVANQKLFLIVTSKRIEHQMVSGSLALLYFFQFLWGKQGIIPYKSFRMEKFFVHLSVSLSGLFSQACGLAVCLGFRPGWLVVRP